MSDMKIEDAVQDSDITGVEKLPVSDAGVAKCMTIGQVKDFVIGRIGALTRDGAVDISENAVYLNKGATLVPVSASVFANAILSFAFGKAGTSVLDGNETFSIKNGAMLQSVTLAQIKTWLQDEMSKTHIAALDTAGALADGNLASVSQGGTDKKVTLALLKAFCLAGLYAQSEANTDPISDDDEILCFKSGTLCKVKRSDAGLPDGDVKAPFGAKADAIPTWGGEGKSLMPGYAIAEVISETYGGQVRIPTEMAVRDALKDAGDVKAYGPTTAGKIPLWESNNKLSAGMTVAKSIGQASTDFEIPTAKSVFDAIPNVTLPEIIQYLDSSAADDNIPSSTAVIRLVDELRESLPENLDGRINELTNKSVQDFSSDSVWPYGQRFYRTGYKAGTMAIVRVVVNNSTGQSEKCLYIKIDNEYNGAWKFIKKLTEDYPTE